MRNSLARVRDSRWFYSRYGGPTLRLDRVSRSQVQPMEHRL
jgi:hypothetical protein